MSDLVPWRIEPAKLRYWARVVLMMYEPKEIAGFVIRLKTSVLHATGRRP